MLRKSLRNKKQKRISRKKKFLYGGAKKYTIHLKLNLENSDVEKILDPTLLSPEYQDLLETHLTDLIPSNSDLDLVGSFDNTYLFTYNNREKYYITFTIIIKYNSDTDDFTDEKILEFIGLMTEMDAPFTSEDEITYFITYDFDLKRDVHIDED
jgi:hypothetical protein